MVGQLNLSRRETNWIPCGWIWASKRTTDRISEEVGVIMCPVFVLFVFLALQPILVVISQPGSGLKPPRFRGFLITHNDTPQSVGLLWTSYQSVAETSTWQHTTLTTNIHARDGTRTHNLSRRAAEDLCLRPCGHWDRLMCQVVSYNNTNEMH